MLARVLRADGGPDEGDGDGDGEGAAAVLRMRASSVSVSLAGSFLYMLLHFWLSIYSINFVWQGGHYRAFYRASIISYHIISGVWRSTNFWGRKRKERDSVGEFGWCF